MKRKVIQIANSTQLISLPRPWAKKFNIKKGEELDVTINNDSLLIKIEGDGNITKDNKIELNVDDLDRSSIMYTLRALYIKGYDEIKLTFNKPTTLHYRLKKEINIISIIHQELNRLVGIEVMQQKSNVCVLRHISVSDIKEFDTILRRIFILLVDASSDLLLGIKKKDWILVSSLEQKHDSLTKFISYCLRMLNKRGYVDYKQTPILYHIIASLDNIVDILKNCSRKTLKFKQPLKKETILLLEKIHQSIEMYYDLFYKFDNEKIRKFSQFKEEIKEEIIDTSVKIPKYDLLILSTMKQILEIILDLTVSKTALAY